MSANDDNQPPKPDQVRDLLGPPLTPEQREEKRKALTQRQREARAGTDLSSLLSDQPPPSPEAPIAPVSTATDSPAGSEKAVAASVKTPVATELPVREDLLKPAVSFLSSPNVRSADRGKKLAFLQSKGLNQREIQEAFNRVGEVQPDAAAIAVSL